MTGKEKFALVKAFRDARMASTYGPQVIHQFNCCLNAVMDVVCRDREEYHQFQALVDRDNWIPQDNPFKD